MIFVGQARRNPGKKENRSMMAKMHLGQNAGEIRFRFIWLNISLDRTIRC